MQSRETHLSKRSISFRNAIKYLAIVIAEAAAHRANIVVKWLVATHLTAK